MEDTMRIQICDAPACNPDGSIPFIDMDRIVRKVNELKAAIVGYSSITILPNVQGKTYVNFHYND